MDLPLYTTTKSAEETESFGQILGDSYLKSGNTTPRVIVCIGELGSGKTTFVRGLAKGLGLDGRLLSPTFIIVRRYNILKVSNQAFLYHLDLYRLQSELDLESIGIDEMLQDMDSVVVIEWPDRLGKMKIDQPVLVVTLETRSDESHDCRIEMKPYYENAR